MSAPRCLVAGSGRTGRELGRFLAAAGHGVVWISRSPARLEALERAMRRAMRDSTREPEFRLLDEEIPTADLAFESVEEDPGAKRRVAEALVRSLTPDGLLLSNSSSILPSEIHPRCAGLHGFFPLALTGFAELIVEPGPEAPPVERLTRLAQALKLRVVLQDRRRAFAVNRLFLPVQNEAVRAVMAGADPARVDRDTAVAGMPFGALLMMDSIGLDTVWSAVQRYRARMSPPEAADLAPLASGLEALVAMGKRGRKGNDGFLCGRECPWRTGKDAPPHGAEFARSIEALFRNSCARLLERGEIDEEGLSQALEAAFGVPYPWVGGLPTAEVRSLLRERWIATGTGYWEPSPVVS